jgi:transmembrane sensor
LVDPELAEIRISATLRSDNIEGFVRLVEMGFNTRAERHGDKEIRLHKAR